MNTETLDSDKPIIVPQLSARENAKLNAIVTKIAAGGYWENEGWTDAHTAMLPEAKADLENWLRTQLTHRETAAKLALKVLNVNDVHLALGAGYLAQMKALAKELV